MGHISVEPQWKLPAIGLAPRWGLKRHLEAAGTWKAAGGFYCSIHAAGAASAHRFAHTQILQHPEICYRFAHRKRTQRMTLAQRRFHSLSFRNMTNSSGHVLGTRRPTLPELGQRRAPMDILSTSDTPRVLHSLHRRPCPEHLRVQEAPEQAGLAQALGLARVQPQLPALLLHHELRLQTDWYRLHRCWNSLTDSYPARLQQLQPHCKQPRGQPQQSTHATWKHLENKPKEQPFVLSVSRWDTNVSKSPTQCHCPAHISAEPGWKWPASTMADTWQILLQTSGIDGFVLRMLPWASRAGICFSFPMRYLFPLKTKNKKQTRKQATQQTPKYIFKQLAGLEIISTHSFFQSALQEHALVWGILCHQADRDRSSNASPRQTPSILPSYRTPRQEPDEIPSPGAT